jgi:hypothetical protein
VVAALAMLAEAAHLFLGGRIDCLQAPRCRH